MNAKPRISRTLPGLHSNFVAAEVTRRRHLTVPRIPPPHVVGYTRKGTLKTLLAGMLAFSVSVTGVFAQAVTKPAVGDQAPLISGQTQDGKTWKLADAVGKKVVLFYFYPKDDTPGCTKEACGLRDRMGDLQKANVEVIGVSFDSAESHQKFIAKHNLNFTLLTDTDGKIADAYGVRVAGKNIARRVSFLIGKDGKILHVTDAQSADTHLTEMSEAVAKLKKD